jgi:hypothetical protein
MLDHVAVLSKLNTRTGAEHPLERVQQTSDALTHDRDRHPHPRLQVRHFTKVEIDRGVLTKLRVDGCHADSDETIRSDDMRHLARVDETSTGADAFHQVRLGLSDDQNLETPTAESTQQILGVLPIRTSFGQPDR